MGEGTEVSVPGSALWQIGYIFIIMLITVGVFNLIMAVFIELLVCIMLWESRCFNAHEFNSPVTSSRCEECDEFAVHSKAK